MCSANALQPLLWPRRPSDRSGGDKRRVLIWRIQTQKSCQKDKRNHSLGDIQFWNWKTEKLLLQVASHKFHCKLYKKIKVPTVEKEMASWPRSRRRNILAIPFGSRTSGDKVRGGGGGAGARGRTRLSLWWCAGTRSGPGSRRCRSWSRGWWASARCSGRCCCVPATAGSSSRPYASPSSTGWWCARPAAARSPPCGWTRPACDASAGRSAPPLKQTGTQGHHGAHAVEIKFYTFQNIWPFAHWKITFETRHDDVKI